MHSDGSQIGALQTVVTFSSDYFTPESISIANSRCSLWVPANSAPPGQNLTRVTPYFYNNKVIISCGFTGSGYNGIDGLIATIYLTPYIDGTTSLSFSNNYFAFLGSSIAPGAMDSYGFTITGSPTPTDPNSPLPSVTPSITPNPTAEPTASVSATPTPIVNTTTLFSDVKVQDVTNNLNTTSGSTTTQSTGQSELEVVEENNAVPAPPDNLSPRPKATPFTIGQMNNQELELPPGEVMSAQGLRDLLIPGKSKADKTVVMINFITTLIFLLLLAFVIWRMALNGRSAKLKSQYIQELISGELAALESKMNIIKEKTGQEKFEAEFEDTVEHILDELNPKAVKEQAPEENKQT